MDCRDCKNINCFVNNYCLPNWLGYIQYNKTSKLLASERMIFTAGDLVEGIYIICSGKAKVLMKTHNHKKKEKVQIIRVAGDGQILGHRGISEEMIYPISAETILESEIAYISNTDFIKLINSNKDFAYHMIMFYADELLQSEQKLRVTGIQSIEEKVAIAIISIVNAFGYKDENTGELDLSIGLKELANFAIVSLPSLHKVIDILISKGVIELNNKTIFLLSESRLRNIASFDY
jgi:CRP-like cAMP-binding protein